MKGAFRRLAVASLLSSLMAAPVAAGDVKLEIRNGRVTLDARDVPVRQILAEWARVGQVRIVNADKITGGQVTLQLTDVAEGQALDILLRSVSGYVAAPRAVAVENASTFDRILVLPTSAAPPGAAAPGAQRPTSPPFPLPGMPPAPLQPADQPDDDEPEQPVSNMVPGVVPGPAQPFPGMPQGTQPLSPLLPPNLTNPLQPPQRGTTPGNTQPGTVAPGVIAPPLLPNQPNQPNRPPNPRPPGERF